MLIYEELHSHVEQRESEVRQAVERRRLLGCSPVVFTPDVLGMRLARRVRSLGPGGRAGSTGGRGSRLIA